MPTPQLHITAWFKGATAAAGEHSLTLDWRPYMDRDTGKLPDTFLWDTQMRPQLIAARDRLRERAQAEIIELYVDPPLSVALGVGTAFPIGPGCHVAVEQRLPDRPTEIWRSDVPPSELRFRCTELELGAHDGEPLICVVITGDAQEAARLAYEEAQVRGPLIYASPATPGYTALGSAADALALANHARALIQQYRRFRRRTHLIIYGPKSFAIFLGQRLNALGEIVAYEFSGGRYIPTITYSTDPGPR